MDTSSGAAAEEEGQGRRPKRSTRFSGDFQTTFAELESSEDEKAEKKHKSSSGKGSKRTKDCPGCGAVLNISIKQCSLCDYQFTSKSMIASASAMAQESLDVRERYPFEPERDDDGSLFIQSIEGRRPRKKSARRWMRPGSNGNRPDLSDVSAQEAKFEFEYLVKYKNMSYRDVQWLSATEIDAMGLKNKNLLNRYLLRIDKGDPTVHEEGEIDPIYLDVERVLDYREEEVTEIVDDVAGQNEALDAAAADDDDDNDDEDVEEDEEDVIKRGPATSTQVVKAEPAVASSSIALTTNRRSFGGSSEALSTMAADAAAPADGVGAEVKPLSQSQINTLVFNPVERCRKVLEKIYDDPYSDSFQLPVDTELYTDYLDVVEEPMCLQTVSQRLEAGWC